ncbi:DNA-binding transcriptional MerR regulator [Prauserella shujinwangii]|uniref:DNA-binding transcriptional MerR regulator n=1 Tax=Prauserella shujinwangii TaxID=1453103 RepID=A0A2T0LYN5_9PSEU|nr:MerR family transcriptional regulator [Prauserella shujinwangii]PRX49219.1 DNA-binding transcriptional MerR regulator [Prauserella shujinwangii]
MLIGELARRTGVSPRLLRYYEQQGLLDSARGPNGYRHFGDDAVTTVRQIRALLAAGLSTDVIRTVLPCARGTAPELEYCPELVRTLSDELADLDSRIDTLRRSRESLAAFLPVPG